MHDLQVHILQYLDSRLCWIGKCGIFELNYRFEVICERRVNGSRNDSNWFVHDLEDVLADADC